MKTLLVLFSLSCSIQSAAEITTPFMFARERAEAQAHAGLHLMSEDTDSSLYAAANNAIRHVVVSKSGFANIGAARAFCAFHYGYRLTDSYFVRDILEKSLPFAELWPVSILQIPVLESREGLINGSVFWAEPQAQEINHLDVGSDDFVFATMLIQGEVDWNFQSLAAVNARMTAADIPPVNVPAICIEAN